MTNAIKLKIYEAMDSFLTETDKPRSIENLNQDRHLFVKKMEELFTTQEEELGAYWLKRMRTAKIKTAEAGEEMCKIKLLQLRKEME